MSKSTTVLAQVLHLIPSSLFENLAVKYKTDKGVRKLTAKVHFTVLLFAQYSGLNSLRVIEQATTALMPFQSAFGLISVKRSTLSDTNRRIPWLFYQELFFQLIQHFRYTFPKHQFKLPGKLLSIDSSTIKLCLSLFPWAKFRQQKGALKLHTLLDHDGHIPSTIVVTDGKVSDIRVGKAIPFTKGDTLLFDRGYFDSTWFYKLNIEGIFFVTRMKSNIGFSSTKRRQTNRKAGVWRDWIGVFDGIPRYNYPEKLRLIKFKDPETGKILEFLTNLMDLPAETIAELYKQRWQVELFFKWIKQHLKIKTFLGTDENSVMIQIWIAMIAFLLVRVKVSKAPKEITTHLLMVFIGTMALQNIPISYAWQDFHRGKTKQKAVQKTKIRN